MAVYWLTFRLKEDAGYSKRYDNLVEAVRDIMEMWWIESTSFFVFEAPGNIDTVAAAVKAAINPAVDLALIGMPDYKSARAIGAIQDQDLFRLIPFAKKA